MEKKIVFRKSIITNVIILIFLQLFFYPRYDNEADIVMQEFLHNGIAHIMFSNYLLGGILSALYSAVPRVAWYYAFHVVCSFLAIETIAFLLIKRNKGKIGIIIAFVVSAFLGTECYLLPTYVKTAAVMAFAAFFLLAEMIESGNCSIMRALWAILLSIVGGMISWKTYIFVAVLAAMEFVHFSVKRRLEKKNVLSATLILLFALVCVAISAEIDNKAYNNDYWEDAYSYRHNVEKLYSFGTPDYEDLDKTLLSESISEESYDLIRRGIFMPSEETLLLLDDITDAGQEMTIGTIFAFVRRTFGRMPSTGMFYLWFILSYFFFAYKRERWAKVFSLSVLISLVGMYYLYIHNAMGTSWMLMIALLPLIYYLLLELEAVECGDEKEIVVYLLVIGVILYNRFGTTLRMSVPDSSAKEDITASKIVRLIDYNQFMMQYSVFDVYPGELKKGDAVVSVNGVYGLCGEYARAAYRDAMPTTWLYNPLEIDENKILGYDTSRGIIVGASDWNTQNDGATLEDDEIILDAGAFAYLPCPDLEKGKYDAKVYGEGIEDLTVGVYAGWDYFLEPVIIGDDNAFSLELPRRRADLEIMLYNQSDKTIKVDMTEIIRR